MGLSRNDDDLDEEGAPSSSSGKPGIAPESARALASAVGVETSAVEFADGVEDFAVAFDDASLLLFSFWQGGC